MSPGVTPGVKGRGAGTRSAAQRCRRRFAQAASETESSGGKEESADKKSARSGLGEGDGRAQGGLDRAPAQRFGCVVVDHRRPGRRGEEIEIRCRHAHQENAADVRHAIRQHALAGHLFALAMLLMSHAVHGATAHIGTGRIDRRDLKHRGAQIGGHDQQGQNMTEQFHRPGAIKSTSAGGIFYPRFIT